MQNETPVIVVEKNYFYRWDFTNSETKSFKFTQQRTSILENCMALSAQALCMLGLQNLTKSDSGNYR
jgi:hypothetical protein